MPNNLDELPILRNELRNLYSACTNCQLQCNTQWSVIQIDKPYLNRFILVVTYLNHDQKPETQEI